MPSKLIPYFLTCGPLFPTLVAWTMFCLSWKRRKAFRTTLAALCAVTATASYSAYFFTYYELHPSPELPPWKDPQTLNLGMLFLFAPIGMIVAFVAWRRGASPWLVGMLELASVPLFLVGLMESSSV